MVKTVRKRGRTYGNMVKVFCIINMLENVKNIRKLTKNNQNIDNILYIIAPPFLMVQFNSIHFFCVGMHPNFVYLKQNIFKIKSFKNCNGHLTTFCNNLRSTAKTFYFLKQKFPFCTFSLVSVSHESPNKKKKIISTKLICMHVRLFKFR